VKISILPVATVSRQYPECKRRYKDMHLSSDFVKHLSHWVQTTRQSRETMFSNSPVLNFDPKFALPVTKNLSPTLDKDGVKHNAKVVLLTYDGSDSKDHITYQVKFLVSKVDKGLICTGAAWNKADGEDPYDNAVLRNTAIRAAKTMAGIDLSVCKNWLKFNEIWYDRPAEGDNLPALKERVVIYVPDTWNHPDLQFDVHYHLKGFSDKKDEKEEKKESEKPAEEPKAEEPKAEEAAEDGEGKKTEEAKEEDEEMDEEAKAKKEEEKAKKKEEEEERARRRKEEDDRRAKEEEERQRKKNTVLKGMSISLDGLLDYDVDDTYEKTTELSMFAECFHEMLQYDFGYTILKFLQTKQEWDRKEKEARRAKRKAEDAEAEEREKKRRKLEEEEAAKKEEAAKAAEDAKEAGEEEPAADKPKDTEMKDAAENGEGKTEEGTKEESKEEKEDDKPKEEPKEEPKETEEEKAEREEKEKIKAEAKKAFQFFDKSGNGYLRPADLEMIIYNLEADLPRRIVRDVVGTDERVDYTSMCK